MLLAGLMLWGGVGCSFVNREFEKDRRNPDNVPVDKAREQAEDARVVAGAAGECLSPQLRSPSLICLPS